MKKRIIVILTAVLAILALLWLPFSKSGHDASHNNAVQKSTSDIQSAESGLVKLKNIERDQNLSAAIAAIYSSPINLYGCVVDEKGNPVSGALVEYSLNDKHFKDGTKGTTMSDARGNFLIEGMGASIYVNVEKKGYYRVTDQSYGSVRADRITSLQMPARFVLKKAGIPQKLIHNKITTRLAPTDGAPVEIHLARPKLVAVQSGHFRIEVWIAPVEPGRREGFEWKCRLSVPAGGLTERTDTMHFEAPADGYVPSIEFTMPAAPIGAQNWRSSLEKQLYLRLSDGTHARGRLYISFDPDRALVSFDSFWNQSPTEPRNLEAGANEFGKAL
jgi:hypothetical protein